VGWLVDLYGLSPVLWHSDNNSLSCNLQRFYGAPFVKKLYLRDLAQKTAESVTFS